MEVESFITLSPFFFPSFQWSIVLPQALNAVEWVVLASIVVSQYPSRISVIARIYLCKPNQFGP
jgi:hypothetical protein